MEEKQIIFPAFKEPIKEEKYLDMNCMFQKRGLNAMSDMNRHIKHITMLINAGKYDPDKHGYIMKWAFECSEYIAHHNCAADLQSKNKTAFGWIPYAFYKLKRMNARSILFSIKKWLNK